MFWNYLKTSARALVRNRAHAAINILGLTLGLLCALIIFQLIRFELSFGQDTPDAEEVYRVYREEVEFGQRDVGAGLPYPFFEAFRTDFPDVPLFTIIDDNIGSPLISVIRPDGSRAKFEEEADAGFVDATFFDVFPRTWAAGSPETAFAQPFSVVLSETLAAKYFGDADPMGQQIRYDDQFDFTVTGIVNDSPTHSNVPLDLILSADMGSDTRSLEGRWGSISSGVQGFLRLSPGVTAASIEERFPDFVLKHQGEEGAEEVTYRLQPLLDMHFSTELSSRTYTTDQGTIWAFILIGAFLLLTACINFVNLNTVLVFKRAKEVGVRKMLGGTPGHIVNYFMTETGLITTIALVCALLLAAPGLGLVRQLTGSEATLSLADPVVLGMAVLMGGILLVLAGLYPAFLLARLRPAVAVKNQTGHRPGAFMNLRRGLVVFQFAISQVLIIATLVAALQMRYLHNAPMGYNTEALVEFYLPVHDDATTHQTLRDELLRSPHITNVTFSNSGASSGSTWGSNFYFEVGDERIENETQVKLVDLGYLDTYGMNLLAGRHFPHDDSASGFIINETMVALMGLQSPADAIDVPMEVWDNEGQVIGVIQDFHTNSLHRPIEPTVLFTRKDYKYFGAAKVNTQNMNAAVADIQRTWEAAFPAFVFDYTFHDERIRDFYEMERNLHYLLQAFALISILIGCIGLFGLISYTTTQRSKEVGVRKVLGATVPQIVGLFTREFVVMVVLGFAISAPLAYVGMQAWLSDFAYQIDLGPVIFLTAFAISLAIALTTVGYRTYRAAVANPVDSIRYE